MITRTDQPGNHPSRRPVAPHMRALWILAHPEPTSLSAHLRDVGIETMTESGWHVEQSDLYAMNWDPVLRTPGGPDVGAEQRKVCAADLVVMQFPLWWYGMPAIMKGWLDRVFEAGYAYDVIDPATGRARKYGDGGLTGRRALALVTAGDRPGSLGPRGISGSIEDVLWPILHGTFWYTGMSALRPHLVTGTGRLDDSAVADLDRDLVTRLRGIADEAPIPYLPLDETHYDHDIKLLPHVSPGVAGNAAHRAGQR